MNVRGFTLVEITVVLAVVAVLAMVVMPFYSSWTFSQRIRIIHDDADLLFLALDEHYRRNCAIVPFPQPTIANLTSQQILLHDAPLNIYGGQYVLSISGARTSTPVATISLPFTDASMASAVASRNRGASLSGSQVIWKKTLGSNKKDSGAIGMSGQSLFSVNGC